MLKTTVPWKAVLLATPLLLVLAIQPIHVVVAVRKNIADPLHFVKVMETTVLLATALKITVRCRMVANQIFLVVGVARKISVMRCLHASLREITVAGLRVLVVTLRTTLDVNLMILDVAAARKK